MTHDDEDVSAGALYDRGTYLYTLGNIGSRKMDYLGRTLLEHYQKTVSETSQPKTDFGYGMHGWAEHNQRGPKRFQMPKSTRSTWASRYFGTLMPVQRTSATRFTSVSRMPKTPTLRTAVSTSLARHISSCHETSTPAVVPTSSLRKVERLLKGRWCIMMHMDNPRLKELPPLRELL